MGRDKRGTDRNPGVQSSENQGFSCPRAEEYAPVQEKRQFSLPLPMFLFMSSTDWKILAHIGEGDLLYSVH